MSWRGKRISKMTDDGVRTMAAGDDEPPPAHPVPHRLANDAIGRFLEYRDRYGHDGPDRRGAAA